MSVSLATLASFSPSTNRLYSSFNLAASVSFILWDNRGGGAERTTGSRWWWWSASQFPLQIMRHFHSHYTCCEPLPGSYFCMVFWRVSTLFWQRSSVRLVMFTLMESIHTLSEEQGKETGGAGRKDKRHEEKPFLMSHLDISWSKVKSKNDQNSGWYRTNPIYCTKSYSSPILWASSNTTTDFLASSLDTRSAILGSSR